MASTMGERIWYYIGIAGTIILIIMYFATRIPNPIIGGRALPINNIGIATEIFQFIYVGITAYIVTKPKRDALAQKERLK